MALTPAEQQSLEYTAQEKRRAAFQKSLQAKLKAPSGPAQATKEKWRPLLGRRFIR